MGHDFPPAQLSFTKILSKNQTRKCLKVAAAQCTRRTIPEHFMVQPNQQRCWRGRGETPFQKPVGYLQRSKNRHQKKSERCSIRSNLPNYPILSEEPCSPNVMVILNCLTIIFASWSDKYNHTNPRPKLSPLRASFLHAKRAWRIWNHSMWQWRFWGSRCRHVKKKPTPTSGKGETPDASIENNQPINQHTNQLTYQLTQHTN